jgi:hypothetical protein
VRRGLVGLMLVGVLAAGSTTACDLADPVVRPLPIAMLRHPDDVSAECVVGMTVAGAAVLTSVGTVGIMAGIAWLATGYSVERAVESCWEDAANTVYQPIYVTFTCDSVHTHVETFYKFVDIYNYMHTHSCFTSGATTSGGGGGGGGGW